MPATRPVSISNNPPAFPALDFKFLYDTGLHHIRQLAGTTWTDHNTHDPGITILEQLCYALTDLAYRLSYDLPDLLTHEDGTAGESLYSAAQILTVNPVTLADIRKVVLDVPGVRNAWVEKVPQPAPDLFYDAANHALTLADADGAAAPVRLAGLYRVLVEPKEDAGPQLEAAVWARLQRCRGLCEDFTEVRRLPAQDIGLAGTIELRPGADIDALAAAVLFQVAEFLSPHIRFYTLQERLASGLTPDAIFDGPVLEHGFIDDAELAAFDRRTEIHVSDVIRVITALPGVTGLHDIRLYNLNSDDSHKPRRTWLLALDPETAPRLACPPLPDKLQFMQRGLVVWPDENRVAALLRKWRAAQHYPLLERGSRDLVPPTGRYRNPGAYYSIQHHFPLVYGLGEVGLPASAPPQRQADTRQLKGYLLFFEQLLAGYFAQVGQLKDLLAFGGKPLARHPFQELIGQVPGAEAVVQELRTAPAADPATAAARLAEQLEQHNRFLDHLLARFGESITDYAQVVPQQWAKAELGEHQHEQLLASKRRFLQAYPQLSNDRGKAFDYTAPSWNTANVSGLEKRVAAKLGIADWRRRRLAPADEEGFHLLEHILLRPLAEDAAPTDATTTLLALSRRSIKFFDRGLGGCTLCFSAGHQLDEGTQIRIMGTQRYEGLYTTRRNTPNTFEIDQPFTKDEAGGTWIDAQLPPDPYSLQLSFIFPDWLPRFSEQKLALRTFVEQTVREQTPAHLRVYVKWLAREEMAAFEAAYELFLEQLQLKNDGKA